MRMTRYAGVAPWLALALATSCQSRVEEPTTLQSVSVGQLADIYGFEGTSAEVLQLHEEDVLIGHEIPEGVAAERLAAHGETTQGRILIRARVGSRAFESTLAELRGSTTRLGLDGEGGGVPSDAALELTFSRPLGAAEVSDQNVQILSGDGPNPTRLPIRVASYGRRVVVDPTLIGPEAHTVIPGVGPGLPEGPTSLALTLNGPGAIPGLAQGTSNAAGVVAERKRRISFRVDTATPRRPLRLVGEMRMRLANVERRTDRTLALTIYKAGIVHGIDRGDTLRIENGRSSFSTSVLNDPREDAGDPSAQHVTVIVPADPRLVALDPERLPTYPATPRSRNWEAWLTAQAPVATLIAEYRASVDESGAVRGDNIANFVTFTPEPLPLASGQPSPPNENVPPMAAAVLRFNAPIDLATARPLDSLFFATRDLLDPAARTAFINQQNIDPQTFSVDKYFTPHLIHGRIQDATGTGNVLQVRTPLGFYLDEVMRTADEGVPFANKSYRYFLHLIAGDEGLSGTDGARLDLGGQNAAVVPFSLDTRKDASGQPFYPDNYVFSVARRFADADEDEQPSYHRTAEVQNPGQPVNPNAFRLPDLTGSVSNSANGLLVPRPTSRQRVAIDDLSQQAPPSQAASDRFCPEQINGESQVAFATAAVPFGTPVETPLVPQGSRTQSVWREIDLGLSRRDFHDMNLDVEAMYWGLFQGTPTTFDEFNRVSLFLGHSEQRPEPCIGAFSALPTLSNSGLQTTFADNYVFNRTLGGNKGTSPAPHAAFVDQKLTIDGTNLAIGPNGGYRFLPLPTFQKPYFVWRDETVMEQGAMALQGNDASPAGFEPYVLSPFLAGQGRLASLDAGGMLTLFQGSWSNERNHAIQAGIPENFSGGSVGSIGLPLLADLWVHPSTANGANGAQVSLPVFSSPQPNFRTYSSGGISGGQTIQIDPSRPEWQTASGGFTLSGSRTRSGDNSVYWMMTDFVKAQSVATAGFVDLIDPHRMPLGSLVDPRLGPFGLGTVPAGWGATFAHDLHAPAGGFPGGTVADVEFRAAGEVDPAPWRATLENQFRFPPPELPNPTNFPLDPFKAGDAHIRKFDDRLGRFGQPRNGWTYYYNRNVTDYVSDPNQLMDPLFTSQFGAPGELFNPEDVRYVNWRMILRNDTDTGEQPTPDGFVFSYRLEAR